MADIFFNTEELVLFLQNAQRLSDDLGGTISAMQRALDSVKGSWLDTSVMEAEARLADSLNKLNLAHQYITGEIVPYTMKQIDWGEHYQSIR